MAVAFSPAWSSACRNSVADSPVKRRYLHVIKAKLANQGQRTRYIALHPIAQAVKFQANVDFGRIVECRRAVRSATMRPPRRKAVYG